MLRINNLSCWIGSRLLFEGLNFGLYAGSITTILGPNGVGKSTLLRAIAGCKNSAIKLKGELLLHQQNIADYAWQEMAHWRALMPQKLKLNFPLRVEEAIALGWSAMPLEGEDAKEILVQLKKELDLETLWGRNLLELSGGEQQRVQLARVLAQLLAARKVKPECNQQLLLLDEPTASLDLHYQHLFLRKIKALAVDWNLAVLVVLHDVNLAARYADQLLLIGQQKQLAFGKASEVLCPKYIEAAFQLQSIVERHPVVGCPQVIMY